ncbi:MAG: transcriptional repressor LexA [Tepidimonas sp.]|uniref:transcriptional repressor LexA n=1 Tax=Tepidimonas sp. TaxID=2002775 RepID=UPI00298F3424|nr:transcriptional repressor LexA [Tepidimonas sp.]MDW8336403.1 transcriptional repressor LexA [Tepidimonas sp.]
MRDERSRAGGGFGRARDASGLTPRQREVLAYIQRCVQGQGVPPTRQEIARAFGFRSPNAAEAHLRALERKGVLELLDGSARGIRLREREMVELLQLPLIGRVAAGSPILAQEHVEAVYPADARWFARRPDYLLRVRGWSMRDAGIHDGDLVAVQAAREARVGQIVVARLGDDVTVKRLQRHGTDGWCLQAANPEVADMVVSPDTPLVIEGVVVGLLRPHGWD